MKKKLLIAGFFASIMLLVPFTSISAGSVIGNVATVEGNAEVYSVIPDDTFDGLKNLMNFLLVNYGDKPEVVEFCNRALEIINLIQLNGPSEAYCFMLQLIVATLVLIAVYFQTSGMENIVLLIEVFATALINYSIDIGCWESYPPILESETGLIQQTTQQTITGLIQSQEINMCQCGQSAN